MRPRATAWAFCALALATCAAAETGRPVAFAKNEIETGHTMLGKIVTVDPRWVLDVGAVWRTDCRGYGLIGGWNASELTSRYDATRRRALSSASLR